jgi:aryl-alcohol dehydrogenase
MKITAAVLRQADSDYGLEEVELAMPGPGEVLVRIVGAGICHTDMLPRRPRYVASLPIITGHEGSGVVEAIGAGVDAVGTGDHVVLSFASCGECRNCQRGQSPYCDTFLLRNLVGRNIDGSTGVLDKDGIEISSRWFGQSSFATYCVVGSRNVVVVDRDLPLELLGPLGCGILTGAGSVLVALDVQADSSIAVFGAGSVGLAAIMAARVVGASTIVAVDVNRQRLTLALELGATHVVEGNAPDVVERILTIKPGGVDYTFDTTGNATVIPKALGALRMAGHCGLVGVQSEPLTLGPAALVGKNLSGILEGGADPQDLIPRLIALWRDGLFPFDRMIDVFPLADINHAERAAQSGEVVKPVLLPN